MSKSPDKIWELLEDLISDELVILGDLVSGLDRLEMVDEAPRYSAEEMDVIGRFQDLPDDEDEELSDAESEEVERAEAACQESDSNDANTASYAQAMTDEKDFQENASAPQL